MIALVPARSGSKGVIRKNLREVAGSPLICHTLRQAKAANSIDRILVSTDDAEVAAVAEQVGGVEVPFLRPPELATDNSPAIDTYLHTAAWLEAHDTDPSALCILLPTAPLRFPSDIDAAIALFHLKSADAVISVTPSKPPEWTLLLAEDGRLWPCVSPAELMRNRQDQRASFQPNGSIFVLSIESLRRSRSYYTNATYGYAMPFSRSIDIDTEEDFCVAEALLRSR